MSKPIPNKTKHTPETYHFGKLPPQAPDIEQAVLGALLIENLHHDIIIPQLKQEMFYKDVHGRIFNAIKTLYNEKKPIDMLTVINQLKLTGELDLVSPHEITNLTTYIASSANIEFHTKIVVQKWLQRSVIAKSSDIINRCYDDSCDIFDSMQDLDSFLSELYAHLIGNDHEIDFSGIVEKTYTEIISRKDSNFTGIDTGSTKLNSVTGGWQSPDLIIIAARPSMGKTARMMSFVKSAANMGKKVAVFSLEMSAPQLIKRQLSDFSGVYGDKILTSNLNDKFDIPKLRLAANTLKKLPIYLNDHPSVTANYIRSVCRERKKKFGLDMIFVDYLTLMRPNHFKKQANRDEVVGEIAADLKAIAKELGLPVMVAAQLNRESDKRGDKRPILSDLRESGAIEQHADIVMGLYRPSYYSQIDDEYKDLPEQQYQRVSELIIMKNRNGKLVRFSEFFYGELSKFTEDSFNENSFTNDSEDLF